MTRKLLFRFIGIALSIACMAYFVLEARQVWSQSGNAIDLIGMSRKMPVAAAFWLAAYAAFAGTWHLLLRFTGLKPPVTASFGIFLTAQFAKYLPGNLGHHAGRIYLSVKHRFPASAVGISMVMEVLLTLLCAGILALPLVDLLLERLALRDNPRALLLPVLVLVLVGLVVAVVLSRTSHLHTIRTQVMAMFAAARERNSARLGGAAIAVTFLGMALASCSLLALCGLDRFDSQLAIAQGIALFCVAWIAGFLTPGAPAGLGMREAILVEGLKPMIGLEAAVGSTILLRVLSVAADLGALLVGLMLLRTGSARSCRSEAPSAAD